MQKVISRKSNPVAGFIFLFFFFNQFFDIRLYPLSLQMMLAVSSPPSLPSFPYSSLRDNPPQQQQPVSCCASVADPQCLTSTITPLSGPPSPTPLAPLLLDSSVSQYGGARTGFASFSFI